ncbi:MAG: imidazole glycerol phosphate synthase subunit HisH [Clostridiales Family XIII bacterium]|jgi:glutamine amidotransferase|nr:imidazole glycerol phosphate synthase subunit HisH [Clostridiales Family XIII bacterium]
MIGIADYGSGNLFNVKNALDFLGFQSEICADERGLREADKIILPGVGAFPDAMRMLRAKGLERVICEEARRKPLLGICLGMQILFEVGYEFEKTSGLGLIEGYADKLVAPGMKIPHMGWNDVELVHPCPLTEGTNAGDMVYFVHSYKAVTDERNVNLSAFYGESVPALVSRGNVYGAQFHPEKSGRAGLNILRNFAKL